MRADNLNPFYLQSKIYSLQKIFHTLLSYPQRLFDIFFQKTPKSQHFRDIYLVKYYQDNRTENCIPKK